jgi:hypothetical protein
MTLAHCHIELRILVLEMFEFSSFATIELVGIFIHESSTILILY